MEQTLEEKLDNVIQDLEAARSYALSVGMDTLALRFHESVNVLLDMKMEIEQIRQIEGPRYNNCSELQDIIFREIKKRDGVQF